MLPAILSANNNKHPCRNTLIYSSNHSALVPCYAPVMKTPTLIQSLTQLVAAPSVSSTSPGWDQDNRKVIELLDQWFSSLGFTTLIQPIPGCPDKFNLIASAGSGEQGLVLAGHTDTVPYDEGRWQVDPFKLSERDNRLYGLGSCDMKGFFSLVLEAVRDLDLKQPLTIIATADEETTMCGAKALGNLGQHLGRHVVIGEPTSNRPIRMHKGMMMRALRIRGSSGHSSDPSLGNSALDAMQAAMQELLEWRKQLQENYRNPLFAVEVPTLNLGHIHGGDSPNRICAECELHFDLRPLPGMNLDQLHGEIEQLIEKRLGDRGLQITLEKTFDGIPPMETAAEAAIVKAAESLTGHQAETVAFGTEAPYFNAMGMETVVMGPGDIAQAHQPNEFVAIDQLQPGVDILKSLIKKFCL